MDKKVQDTEVMLGEQVTSGRAEAKEALAALVKGSLESTGGCFVV